MALSERLAALSFIGALLDHGCARVAWHSPTFWLGAHKLWHARNQWLRSGEMALSFSLAALQDYGTRKHLGLALSGFGTLKALGCSSYLALSAFVAGAPGSYHGALKEPGCAPISWRSHTIWLSSIFMVLSDGLAGRSRFMALSYIMAAL